MRIVVRAQKKPGETLDGYIEAARTKVPIESYFAAEQPLLPPIAPEVSRLKSDVRSKVEFHVVPREENGHFVGYAFEAWIGQKKVGELLTRERESGCPPEKECFEITEEVEKEYRGKGIGSELLLELSDFLAKSYHPDDVELFIMYTGMGREPWWRQTVAQILEGFTVNEETSD